MIIIFEGIDGSGKTTIKNKINELFEFKDFSQINEFRHCDYLKTKRDLSLHYAAYNQMIMNACYAFDNFSIDRYHISEAVYSQINMRETHFSFSEIEKYFIKLEKDIVIVYCECNYEKYKKRLIEREENVNMKEKEYSSLQKIFEKYLTKSELKSIIINTTDTSVIGSIAECICKIGMKK